MTTAGIRIFRAADRAVTRTPGVESRHSFSFGDHYDPDNVGFGPLVVVNEDRLTGDGGFDAHPHRDVEIVTWVLSGALEHTDSLGHRDILEPGFLQRLTAGAGVSHTERSAGPAGAHYVQMWVLPEAIGGPASYHRTEVAGLDSGDLVPIRIARPGAGLGVARLSDGRSIGTPVAPLVHIMVTAGTVSLSGSEVLYAGDTARIKGSTGRRLTALSSSGPGRSEVLIWQFGRD